MFVSMLLGLAVQSLPAGYSTTIKVSAWDGTCRVGFVLANGQIGYRQELPMQGIAAAFDDAMAGNLDAEAEVTIEPLQEWGKANAARIEAACARSAASNGNLIVAVS